MKATEAGRLRSTEIEAARKTIAHSLGKTGKLWTRIFPDRPYTQKPAEVKMGKGKGDVAGYVAVVKPGRVLFELAGIPLEVARAALEKASVKLPVKTQIINRNIEVEKKLKVLET